jgi:hypothetical protein
MGNISGWTEGILLTLAFVTILGLVIGGLNSQYGKSYSLGITDNNTEELFINYQDTASQQLKGGEVAFDAQQGISLKNSYGLATDAISISWSFLSGGFIEKAAQMWNVGAAGLVLAKALRIIWFLSLVFALLYALFKVVI